MGERAERDGSAGSVEACAKRCAGETNCEYFALAVGYTCNRYSSAGCILAANPDGDGVSYSVLYNKTTAPTASPTAAPTKGPTQHPTPAGDVKTT